MQALHDKLEHARCDISLCISLYWDRLKVFDYIKMDSIMSVLKFQATVKKHITNLAKGGNLAVKRLHDARLPTLYTRCLVVCFPQ